MPGLAWVKQGRIKNTTNVFLRILEAKDMNSRTPSLHVEHTVSHI